MSFPRKRASVACDFCRYKKRRCDGRKPVCSNCEDSSADCIYQELPTQRFDNSQLYERIQQLEQAIERHERLLQRAPTSPASDSLFALPLSRFESSADSLTTSFSPAADAPFTATPAAPAPGTATPGYSNMPPLNIPSGHNTSAVRVLQLPQIRSLIGDYPDDYFYNIESRRTLPPSFDLLTTDIPFLIKRDTDALIATYLSTVHPHHPVLGPEILYSLYEKVLRDGLQTDLKSAVVLVVLALGCAATATTTTTTTGGGAPIGRTEDELYPGARYFRPAIKVINAAAVWDFGNDPLLAQSQVLAGIYFAYLARPLHSWRLIHAASMSVQLLLCRRKAVPQIALQQDHIIHLFWSCFLIECDRLAEFELPRSGIENLVDDMVLPGLEPTPDPSMVYFLAEISIRRLLNRVHNTLYTPDGKTRTIGSLLTVCDELNRQLELWHESIPEVMKPRLGTAEPADNDRKAILRIRYYATRHIIFRPFVLRAIADEARKSSGLLSPQPEDLSDSLYRQRTLDNCARCLESCRLYLLNTGHILRKPSPYTWTLSQSSLGAILVITAASLSPSLRGYTPDVKQLQQTMVNNISQWATQDSSISSVLWILKDIQRRQSLLE
ncbi:uncharacterized protein V1510DRAFT_447549 [Dipodascopsis tothii]|uniref:uncharacterized protein n=1 Tax=Dipodascopsis tothii TaxID=44089 RepID=UPI0034CFCDAE